MFSYLKTCLHHLHRSQHLGHLQEGLVDSKPREFRHLLALDASMSELVNVLQPPGSFHMGPGV